MRMREHHNGHLSGSGTDNGRPPWWSRPVTIAIRVIAVIVIAIFVVLTVVRLQNF